jgi:PAS domain S-box-containing protein
MTETLLVVEDDPSHAELVRRALSDFEVELTSSLADARARLALAPQPRLVLADLNLRDGMGYELLPGQHAPPPFPLVVLTAQGDEATAALAIKAGALEYVVKSTESLGELPRIVDRALRDWQLVVERRAAESALRDSEERFRVLFSASPDAFVLHDLKGVVLDANRTAERIFGRSVETLRGRSTFELGLFPPESLATVADRLARQGRGEATGPELYRTKTPDGAPLVVEIRSFPFELHGGVVVLAMGRDVTRQIEAEDARRRLEEQLHQALKIEAMGRLAGGVAHDFNNILTGILGFTELLAAQIPESDPMRGDVAEIRACAEKAASLTSQLLAFSRKQIIESRAFDANEVVERASRMLRRLIGEDVDLQITRAASPSIVSMDPHQLEQVLVNLAVNARDAMPGGGRLAISVRHETLDARACEARVDVKPGRYVVIEVVDTGTGMSETVLAHIFEPFFSTKADKGTGLGLPTSYGIVRQAGGFVEVASRLGEGSTFSLYLPATEASLKESDATFEEPKTQRGREHLLLVEDDDTLRSLVSRYLRQQGYTVHTARHAGDAVLAVEDPAVRIDLLVSDVILPTMNGPTLFRRLSAIRPGLRVLFVSGYSDTEALELARSSGELLAKPFSLEQLATKIREQLDA